MSDEVDPYVKDHLSDSSGTEVVDLPPLAENITGIFEREAVSATAVEGQTLMPLRIESRAYGVGRPRRVITRGKIIRDENQGK